MKNIFFFYFLIFVTIIIYSCNKKNEHNNFYDCNYKLLNFGNSLLNNKWISNKKEAISSKLIFRNPAQNRRNLDSLYNTTAQYVFVFDFCGSGVSSKDCFAEIKHDTILLNYRIRTFNGEVGESTPSQICFEINKLKYPNYRKMKIILKRI